MTLLTFKNRRVIWMFTLIIMLAAGARLLTFPRFLPYQDHNDEPNMYLMARDWRGVQRSPAILDWLDGYPPLYVWINGAVQSALDVLSPGHWLAAKDYYYFLRLVSAFAGIVTTALVIRLGVQSGGRVSGLFAGLVWALAPTVVENNNFALPDPFVYLACAASLVFAFDAQRHAQFRPLLYSLLAAIAAIYLKYSALFILVPYGIAALAVLRKRGLPFGAWFAQALVAVGSAMYLVIGYGAFKLQNREADTFRDQALSLLLDPNRLYNNWGRALQPFGFAVVLLPIGAALWVFLRGQRARLAWIAVLLYCAAGIFVTVTFTNVGDLLKMRHTLPITLALCAIFGTLVALLAARVRPVFRVWTLVACAALFVLPALVSDLDNISRFQQIETRVLLGRWSAASLPNDGKILMSQIGATERTWNRDWGGYDGAPQFEWWFTEPDTTSQTPARWVERGIAYFSMSDADQSRFFNSPEYQKWIALLTPVKSIAPQPGISVGPTLHLYRMLAPQVATDATYGNEIRLVGYDFSGAIVKAGETIRLRPYWRTLTPPRANYSMFVHLIPDGQVQQIAQVDAAPALPTRLTLQWDDPAELYFGAGVTLQVPTDTAPGRYTLAIGLYDFATGARLPLANGATAFTIPMTISAP